MGRASLLASILIVRSTCVVEPASVVHGDLVSLLRVILLVALLDHLLVQFIRRHDGVFDGVEGLVRDGTRWMRADVKLWS